MKTPRRLLSKSVVCRFGQQRPIWERRDSKRRGLQTGISAWCTLRGEQNQNGPNFLWIWNCKKSNVFYVQYWEMNGWDARTAKVSTMFTREGLGRGQRDLQTFDAKLLCISLQKGKPKRQWGEGLGRSSINFVGEIGKKQWEQVGNGKATGMSPKKQIVI